VVADFRSSRPDDTTLVEVAAWASYAAASLIGQRQGGLEVAGQQGTSGDAAARAGAAP
jgi:hypothetical protein